MKGYDVATIGRRKTAVARAYVKSGEGNITINGLPHSDYFSRETSIMVLEQPLQILNKRKDYDIKINVIGGGKSGQAGACRLAIARALNDLNGEDRSALKKEGFLTRDAREVERKKYGRHKARKSTQFSKR